MLLYRRSSIAHFLIRHWGKYWLNNNLRSNNAAGSNANDKDGCNEGFVVKNRDPSLKSAEPSA